MNILGSLNVCEAAVAGGTRKVVFAGSGGTLYGVPESVPTRESHPQRPISPYGVSKKAAGDYLHFYREVHGLEYTDARARERLRAAPGSERRGGRGRDLRRRSSSRAAAARSTGRRADPGLRVRRRRVDAFVRAAERGGGLLMNIGTGIETSVRELYGAMASARRARGTSPHRAPARAGELARSCARSRPRRHPTRLEAVDLARRGPRTHPRLVPHPHELTRTDELASQVRRLLAYFDAGSLGGLGQRRARRSSRGTGGRGRPT